MQFEKIREYRNKVSLFTNYLVVLFAFVMPINPYLGRKVFSLILIFWIISIHYKTIWVYLKKNKIFMSIIIFSLLFIFSILWSEDTSLALKWIQVYTKYFFLPIIIFSTIVRFDFMKYIVLAFVFSMMVNELISYSIFFGGIKEIFGFSFTGNSYNPVPFQSSHISYSLYIAFAVFLGMYKMFDNTNIYFKIVTGIFMVTMIINLFLSAGRTGQFMFAITGVLLLVIYFMKNKKVFISLLAFIIASFTMAYHFSETFNIRVTQAKNDLIQVLNHKNYNSSYGVRLGSYIILPELLSKNNLLIGAGIGDIQKEVDATTSKKFGEKSEFSNQKGFLHNTFLEILVSLGILGFISFIYFLYLLFISKYKNPQYRYISYLVFFTILFSGISVSFFTDQSIMFLLSLFIPISIVSHQEEMNL